jgi:hypothetical protein
VVSIDAPDDTVEAESTYTPLATVQNYGNRAETFDVVCTIDGYADTSTVPSLLPDSVFQISFADWSAPSVGPYTICVRAHVLSDPNPSNDSLCQSIEAVTGLEEIRHYSSVPLRTQLFQNTPNPFSRTTTIEYAVSGGADVDVSVYDSSGRLVKVLVNERKTPGYYVSTWDGRDENGNGMSNGIYFCKMVSGKTFESKKMALVR